MACRAHVRAPCCTGSTIEREPLGSREQACAHLDKLIECGCREKEFFALYQNDWFLRKRNQRDVSYPTGINKSLDLNGLKASAQGGRKHPDRSCRRRDLNPHSFRHTTLKCALLLEMELSVGVLWKIEQNPCSLVRLRSDSERATDFLSPLRHVG